MPWRLMGWIIGDVPCILLWPGYGMSSKYRYGCVLLIALLFATRQWPSFAHAALPASCEPRIGSVRDLGTVTTPITVVARDGGASGLVGQQLLWVFGDTLFNKTAIDGSHLRSNSAALGSLADPLNVREPVDANGAPYPLLTFTGEEQAYNDRQVASNERVALWPVSIVPDSAQTALVFYLKLIVKPGVLNYTLLGTGLAEIDQGKTGAVRDPGLLFMAPEPLFASAFVDGSLLYLYGSLNNGAKDLPFGVGRVPLDQVRDQSAYQFWTGARWVSDVTQSAAVLNNIPGDVSVTYNRYLKRYVAVHSAILSNQVLMQLADQPQGPWAEPIVLFTGRSPATGVDYAGRQHPELAAADDGRTMFVSYYHPLGVFSGELRLVALMLDCAADSTAS